MKMTAHEFIHRSAQVLAAAERGETVTVINNGTAVARVMPISHGDVHTYSTDRMGAIQPPPGLGLPGLTDKEFEPRESRRAGGR
ncbi:type II toxin-antitoxin system Phd/YefM family antitoxin [Streptomyces fimicarius]|uniref:type II toxin-antitoxin system Phd/YefM family antitoxin n=1 Tax=Streptomyces griseus TaxID=1911 RepID=UPI0035D89836